MELALSGRLAYADLRHTSSDVGAQTLDSGSGYGGDAMSMTCRAAGCSNPQTEAGEFCELHECFVSDCRSGRAADNRVYCPAHEAAHYAKHGRYAFRCREIGCARPQVPGEEYCEEHLCGAGVEEHGGEETVELASDRFPLLTKILQGAALVVVLAIASWALFSWVAGSGQQAKRPAADDDAPPIGVEPLSERNDEIRELERALENGGYR